MTREQFISNVESTQKALRRFLMALCCGDSHLADDVAQEAYLKAYIACDSFRKLESFKSWIFHIAFNVFIDLRRSARTFVNYDELRETPSSDSAEAPFRYQELYAAMNQLPPKERISVLLYYMEGYSVKEIADIVVASQDAVRQHLARGRNHLRGLLSNN